jgi:citrate synthase
VSRKLYPNVDFYSGLIYRAMGFPTDMFPVLFTIPRVAGWIAHWVEFLGDNENNIYRPRQNYTGHSKREFPEMGKRSEHKYETDPVTSKKNKRREAAQRFKEESK